MTVRRYFIVLPVLAALLLSAGCGGGDGTPFSAEADDPLYQQGQALKRQGKNSEALATFLKVIEKRGEQASPESHLEVGIIYFQHTKDPVEAIHYLRKYLDLEPNSQQAPLVRQRVDLARRELFRSMPGRPSDDTPVRTGLGGQDIIDRLQREIEELRAENDRLKGVNSGASYVRTPRSGIDQAAPSQQTTQVVPVISPDQFLPRGSGGGVTTPSFGPLPGLPPTSAAQVGGTPPRTTTGPAPTTNPAPTTTQRTVPTRPGSVTTPVAGRRHKVAAGDTLFRLHLKYNVTVEAILAVNRDTLPAGANSKLSPGMELKIP